VLKNYVSGEENVHLVKFFLLNAKVLKDIKFLFEGEIDKKWVAGQHRLLEVETRASRDLRFEFRGGSRYNSLSTHDLSIADPFNSYYSVYGGYVI
jgi:uncharacterized protein (DUF1015 family)